MADAIDIISKDFNEFIKSNSDEIPNSFKQISKIAKSDAFAESLMKISRALAVGILLNYCQETIIKDMVLKIKKQGFSKRVVDKRFSRSRAVFDLETESNEDVLQEIKCQELVENCFQINSFEENLSGMMKPMQLGVPQSLGTHVIGGKEDDRPLMMVKPLMSNESESLKLFREKVFDNVSEVVEIVNVNRKPDHVIHANTAISDMRSEILKTSLSLCLQILNSPWSFVPD